MAMGSTFEDPNDLFPPPYIPGDPESARAAAEWQASHRNMTYDLVDELRMPRMPAAPRTAANATEGLNTQSFGTDPWLQAGAAMVGLPDRNSPAGKVTNDYAGGDPRGEVDPLALVALAQGGPYDIDARRAAIQARRDAIAKQLTDQQVAAAVAENAPAPGGGGGTGGLAGGGMAASDRGTTAGDMAVSGATPGSVTQQGFFANAVPNDPDPNNVFSAPPPAPSKNALRDEGEDESAPGFDEDAANQSIADMLAEAIANAPAAPTGHVPGENDQDAIDQGHNDVVEAALADAIANAPADAPGAPSSHNSGRSADVVSPSTAPSSPTGWGPGMHEGMAQAQAAAMAQGYGPILGGYEDQSLADLASPGAPGAPGAAVGSPGNFGFTATSPSTTATAPSSHASGRAADVVSPSSPAPNSTGYQPSFDFDNSPSFGYAGKSNDAIVASLTEAIAADHAATAAQAGKQAADKEAADQADMGKSVDMSLSTMAAIADAMTAGMPGGKSAVGDFNAASQAVAAPSLGAPSGPVSPGGSFSGWGGGYSPGGFQAPGPDAPSGWGGSTPGFTQGDFAAAQAAVDALGDVGDLGALGDISGVGYGSITDAGDQSGVAGSPGFGGGFGVDLGDVSGDTGGITDAGIGSPGSPGGGDFTGPGAAGGGGYGDQGPSPGGGAGPGVGMSEGAAAAAAAADAAAGTGDLGGFGGEGSGASGPGGDTAW